MWAHGPVCVLQVASFVGETGVQFHIEIMEVCVLSKSVARQFNSGLGDQGH